MSVLEKARKARGLVGPLQLVGLLLLLLLCFLSLVEPLVVGLFVWLLVEPIIVVLW
jgi:hypothetical protein